MVNNIAKKFALCVSAILLMLSCNATRSSISKKNNTTQSSAQKVEGWVTQSENSALQKQSAVDFKTSINTELPLIEVNSKEQFQTIDGFGYTLTGGSVEVINRLQPQVRKNLLNQVFGQNEQGIGVSYIRLSIGASDLNGSVFSYNDLPAGQVDTQLSKFSLSKDKALIEMIKEILAINPKIKFMAVPWSPPVWMKTNQSSIGGSLKPEYYSVYAQYFVKYIQEMKKMGIEIDAVCPQNEPLHPGNNPSMYMTSKEQGEFIKKHLGPAFRKANIKTKIVLYDHNLDHPEYVTDILSDKEAYPYINGSAFHLYAGKISVMGEVHKAFPQKDLYFTEQWTGGKEAFLGSFNWHIKNAIIGSMRNWSKISLQWNLANDTDFKPHTQGGCTECKGAITINSNSSYTKNSPFYNIAHASKFVPAGSKRIYSTEAEELFSVAFLTPSGKIAVIVQNAKNQAVEFHLKYHNKVAKLALPANAVATYVF